MAERSPEVGDRFSPPYRIPYQVGLFAAVNAVADAYLVIDGPDCVFRKAEWVHGRHDLGSTLLDVLGVHRIAHTGANSEAVIKSRGEAVAERIRQMDSLATPAVVMVCSMPHVAIIGTQYDRVLSLLEPEVSCPLWELPSRSLDGDWLDGYAAVLEALAERLVLPQARLDRSKVAIVGHVMDRTEEDCAANVRELRGLLGALGLEVASVWLEGGPLADLTKAAEAATIVAFPVGRRAARALSARTGASVVEVPTPVGATRTRRVLSAVGEATGRRAEARALADRAIAPLARRLEWVVPHVFLGRKVALAASPDVLGGLAGMCLEVGLEPVLLASPSSSKYLAEPLELDHGAPPALFAPTTVALARAIERASSSGGIDLAVGDSLFLARVGKGAAVEVGFPSFGCHALFDRPSLGFSGWICLLDRMAQALGRLGR